jgi:hypothetical protein
MRRRMIRLYVVFGIILFVIVEFFAIFEIIFRRRLHLDHRPELLLMPVLAAMPLVAAWQAYRHIKIHLSKSGVEQSIWLPIWYELAATALLGYVTLVFTFGLLLVALQAATR